MDGWQLTPYAFFSLAMATVTAGLAVYSWRRKTVPGAGMGALFMASVSFWGFVNTVELSSTDLSTKVALSKVAYVGIVTMPLAWWGFAAGYTGRVRWLTRRTLALLAVGPALAMLLVFTNGAHGLFWSSARLETSGPFVTSVVTYGWAFWVWCAYAYGLLFAGAVLVVSMLARSGDLYTRQGAALLFGVAAPWVGNALYLTDLFPIPNLDPTPFFLLLTGLAMVLAISRFGLLDVVPVARAAVVEGMEDGVIVLNAHHRVLDMNPAAGSVCRLPPSGAIGRPAAEVISSPEVLEEALGGSGEARLEIRTGGETTGTPQRTYEVTFSPLGKDARSRTVRLVVVRDVTECVEAEREVRSLNAELEGRVVERTRRLQESEEKYRAIFENAVEGIFQTSADGRMVTANPAMARIFGYRSPEEMIATVSDVERQFYEDHRSRAELYAAMGQHGSIAGHELRMARRDGSPVWVSASARILYDEAGEPTGFEGTVQDVSERVEARRTLERRINALTRVAASIAVDQPMKVTLGSLAAGVVGTTGADACSVYLIEPKTRALLLTGSHGLPDGYAEQALSSWRPGSRHPALASFESQRPVLVRSSEAASAHDPEGAPWGAVYVLPLVARGASLGTMSLYYPQGSEPTEDETTFLGAVADQAAVAVENSRLFSAAQGAAALGERQRLSRELHDSVSQALYGIALGSRTARTLLDRDDPARAVEPIEYVLSLAEAGLAEMRALIFELRPEALEGEGLVSALEKQAQALEARHGIEVRTDLPGEEPDLTPEAKEALYRIAQEAMQNAVKHSGAREVGVRLELRPGEALLRVGDDGGGFDPSGSFPGHLGLRSMRERAERLGGTVEIESAPLKGTRVGARLPR